MSISLVEDFKTLEELRQDPESILEQVRNTGRPISITLDGKPAVVLLEVKTFERLLRTLNLARLVGPSEEDVLAGRTRPIDEFMSEFFRANKISSAHRRGSSRRRSNNSRSHRSRQKKSGGQVGS